MGSCVNTNNYHELILSLIIIIVGGLAGLINFLFNFFNKTITNKSEAIRYVLASIGAAILVPLLLNMLSSNLIKNAGEYDPINYFVFAGFCFIAGYFSDRFINTIGDKILNDLKETKSKAENAIKTSQANEEKIELLVSNESEVDSDESLNSETKLQEFAINSEFKDEDSKTQMAKIISSFSGKYRFRTSKGIAKELGYSEPLVIMYLEAYERLGVSKRFIRKDGKTLWTLSEIGKGLLNKELSKL